MISTPDTMFTPETLQTVKAHALESPDEEVCGIVVSVRYREVVIRSPNVAPLRFGRQQRARIDGAVFAQAEDAGEIKALYHSHIGTPPTPSPPDIHASERLQLPYLIYSEKWDKFALYIPDGYTLPLTGRPFVQGELDCRTLFIDYYKQALGIEVTMYDWDSAKTEEDAQRIADEVGFVLVHKKTLREHDLLLITLPHLDPLHFAIFLPDGQILHQVEFKLSCRVPYGSRYRVGTRAVYRHRSLVRDTDAVHH